jgi:SpoVK/Ycf46/Vps4 family AAA+-type ATPase
MYSDKREMDVFRKYKVRYESSQLKKKKLVFKIVNPLTPLKEIYEISYKVQLTLKNKKYTDEYHQLDLALEDQANRNSIDDLDNLYYLIKPKYSHNEFIASDKIKEGIRSAIAREEKKDQIFKEWGLGKVITYGKGTTLNFRGPPGTGKTLAANWMSKILNKQLMVVRYDQIQSMWIGGTEKHIQRVFKIASIKKAVLFFDEADAIALSRENLGRSWEMSTVNTLLKELERYEGVCIFATNFHEKYDKAFERRLTMHIDFELPTQKQRIQILDKHLPKKARDKNLNLDSLDLSLMSGGDIKNLVLNSAGVAARDDSDKIKRKHIIEALAIFRNSKGKEEKGMYFG